MRKKKTRRSPPSIFCNPDICPNCQYIGEGDSFCDATQEIVLSDWEPTDAFMGEGCPYANNQPASEIGGSNAQ